MVVWDLFVRFFHWALTAGFIVAYVTEGEPMWLHSWAGYAIVVLVVLRIAWGFIGPRFARFAEFLRPPGAVLAYLFDLMRFRAQRYVGHSPAGGAMVLALLVLLAATSITGMVDLAMASGKGPLSYWLGPTPGIASTEIGETEGDGEGGPLSDVHAALADITLAFVLLHLVGVTLASIAHRENLPRSMITGRKRP